MPARPDQPPRSREEALDPTTHLPIDPDWTLADEQDLRQALTELLGPPNPRPQVAPADLGVDDRLTVEGP
jgi:hypothetical protein